ncbi:hypothetical protein SNEBB_011499 [Seison nebaliae]|nr:hypothetical protein SNEBB_011499 [Seison nebaliae]
MGDINDNQTNSNWRSLPNPLDNNGKKFWQNDLNPFFANGGGRGGGSNGRTRSDRGRGGYNGNGQQNGYGRPQYNDEDGNNNSYNRSGNMNGNSGGGHYSNGRYQNRTYDNRYRNYDNRQQSMQHMNNMNNRMDDGQNNFDPEPIQDQQFRNYSSFQRSNHQYPNPSSTSSRWGVQLPKNPREEERMFKDHLVTGINFEKYSKIPVEMNPSDGISTYDNFKDYGFHKILNDNIELAGFQQPTPVQKHAFGVISANRDMMACAQTGSGKTAAFLIPILHQLFIEGPGYNREGMATPRVLILAPTRELAQQIHGECRKFSYRSTLRSYCVGGGCPINRHIDSMKNGNINVLVATPGRLVDLLNRGYVKLGNIRFLVLDEADRMLDMGFEPQIRRIVEEEPSMTPVGERLTLMFSATFPDSIQKLAMVFLSNYVFLTVGRIGSTTEDITQRFIVLAPMEKRDYLRDILDINRDKLILVFVETKRECNDLEHFLLTHDYPAIAIHGDKQQADRELALSLFKKNEKRILLATSVAARGLDIPHVSHVINYDMPNEISEYTHRIGRTGRAGNEGNAISFVTDAHARICQDLYHQLIDAKQEIPPFLTNSGYEYSSNTRIHTTKARPYRDFRRPTTHYNNNTTTRTSYGSRPTSNNNQRPPQNNYNPNYHSSGQSSYNTNYFK